jgi:hypothetical protein
MADSSGRPGAPGPSNADQLILQVHPRTEVAARYLATEVVLPNLPTEVATHAETEVATPHHCGSSGGQLLMAKRG